MVSRSEFEKASARAERQRAKHHFAVEARYDGRIARVVVVLSSGLELAIPPRLVEGLETARPGDLDEIEILPSGFGLHFPKLDADLYLPSLMEGVLGSTSWMAARLGAQGGKAKSSRKAKASRANGRKGGRPRKKVA